MKFSKMKFEKFSLMKARVLLLTLAFAFFLSAGIVRAESISGKALFDGTPGENPKINMGADPV